LLVLAALPLLPGCGGGEGRWRPKRSIPREAPPPKSTDYGPVLSDTIWQQARAETLLPLELRGFGLVVGLGENGSGDCPTSIREYLADYLGKEVYSTASADVRRKFSPEKLIDSTDTAVVEVIGLISAGAPKGAVFDLQVMALPGTGTRSLEGGLLLPAELKIYDVATSGAGIVAGHTLARGGGLVFTNPFASEQSATATPDPRRGLVLSGGRTLEERTARLVLYEASTATAQRIDRRLNERFGHAPRVAEAMSRAYVDVHTPPAAARFPERFVELTQFVPLPNHPAFLERKLRTLTDVVVRPGANRAEVALVWEGVGPLALPYVQPLYTHENADVAFYAARTGLRLDDVTALPVIAAIAKSVDHPHRLLAVRALGETRYPQAALELVPLLDDSNQEIRIAAYEALRLHRHPAIRTTEFASALAPHQINTVLDVVESKGKPLIYVRRTRAPRVAVFGPQTPVSVPLFYAHPEDVVTLTANSETDDVTLFSRFRHSATLSEKLVVPPRVVDLIAALADRPVEDDAGKLRGLGLTYSQIVGVLAALCEDGSIPAHLALEQVTTTDLFGPQRRPERPEADEPASSVAPRDDAAPATAPADQDSRRPPS